MRAFRNPYIISTLFFYSKIFFFDSPLNSTSTRLKVNVVIVDAKYQSLISLNYKTLIKIESDFLFVVAFRNYEIIRHVILRDPFRSSE